jgi:hypothetical protein
MRGKQEHMAAIWRKHFSSSNAISAKRQKGELTCDRIDFILLYWSASFSRGNRILFSHKIYRIKVLGPPPNRLRANRSNGTFSDSAWPSPGRIRARSTIEQQTADATMTHN